MTDLIVPNIICFQTKYVLPKQTKADFFNKSAFANRKLIII